MSEELAPFEWPVRWEPALPRILRRVRYVCRTADLSAQDADDVFQEVCLRISFATMSSRHFPTENHLAKWAGRTAWSLVAELRRKTPLAGSHDVSALPAPEGPRSEFDLATCLFMLDDGEEREALRLKYGENLTLEAIARRLGMSIGKVHGLVHAAIRKLRRRFEDE